MTRAERALRRLDGVANVTAVLGDLQVTVTPRKDRTLDLLAIKPVLWRGGLRALRLRLTADGTVEPGPRFRIAGWPESYALDGDLPEGPARIRARVYTDDGAPVLRVLDRDL